MMTDIHYWLALLHLPGVGPMRWQELSQRYASPRALFEQGVQDALIDPGLRESLRAPDWQAVERDLAWAGDGRQILVRQDPRYPPLLAQIHDAPLVLFVHGPIELLTTPQLAIVGSRNPSRLGEETAEQFAHTLAASGLTITSGLALGIDAAAHRGALAGKGQTIAVFGTGPDRIYPASHRDLAHAIVDAGSVLLSEYAPGTPPLPAHFPRRNRIISGLALGTLVVEAALRSGSLLTARSATEQGREVFAIPGSIHSPLSRGCHHLIREGAKLVETAEDVLEELAPQLRAVLAQETAVEVADFQLDADYRHLLECLDFSPTAVDSLVDRRIDGRCCFLHAVNNGAGRLCGHCRRRGLYQNR
ncbi:MAG: DNA-processing protein DprA [Thiohalomonadaceae bacterium]